MLLIIGLGSMVWHIGALIGGDNGKMLQEQMNHADWDGLRLYDLIFPLFVYIAGISQNFSLRKRLSEGKNSLQIFGHMWVRAIILVVLGWLVNGPLVWGEQMRYASVLGLIGLSGALAGSMALLLRSTLKLSIATILILAGTWAAHHWGGEMTPSGCINSHIDALLCPGRLHNGHYDPEGPLCIISATALSLLGYLSGRLFSPTLSSFCRLLVLVCGGTLLILSGYLVGPIIKNIWTVSFVLTATGIGALVLAVFHLLCDILRIQAWTYPLRVVGANALFIYLITHVTEFGCFTERLCGGILRSLLPTEWMDIGFSTAFLLLAWLLALILYRKRIFIRV